MWIAFYVEGCGMSSAEYSVHLVGVNRLSESVVVSFPSSLVGF